MPNRRAAHKQSVTVSIPRDLVKRIDAIAEITNRSRTYIIEHLVRSQINFDGDQIQTDMQVLATAKQMGIDKANYLKIRDQRK
jgi:predicted transcriptional regulator